METITSSTDISALFSRGRKAHTPALMLIVLPTNDRSSVQGGRVAFIAGKKLGNAVWRNAAKRRMRAVCYDLGGTWEGKDILFVAKKPLLSTPYQEICSDTASALQKLGVRIQSPQILIDTDDHYEHQ